MIPAGHGLGVYMPIARSPPCCTLRGGQEEGREEGRIRKGEGKGEGGGEEEGRRQMEPLHDSVSVHVQPGHGEMLQP